MKFDILHSVDVWYRRPFEGTFKEAMTTSDMICGNIFFSATYNGERLHTMGPSVKRILLEPLLLVMAVPAQEAWHKRLITDITVRKWQLEFWCTAYLPSKTITIKASNANKAEMLANQDLVAWFDPMLLELKPSVITDSIVCHDTRSWANKV